MEHGWMCTDKGCGWLAKAQATARLDVPTAPRQCCVFFFLVVWCCLSSYRRDTESRRNVSGADRRETGMFHDVTVWVAGLFDPARCAHLPGHELRKIDCLRCVRFLRTCPRGFLFHRVRGPRTPEVGTGAQQARRLVSGGYAACRVDFVFPRRRLTHLCRKPRVLRWRLHICVRSRAPGQNKNSYSCLRPNWPLNRPSFTW